MEVKYNSDMQLIQPLLLTGPAEPFSTVIQTNTSDKLCVCDTGSRDWSSQIPAAPTCRPRSSPNLWPWGIDWFLQPADTRVRQNHGCFEVCSLFYSPEFFFIVLLIRRLLNGACILNQKLQTWIRSRLLKARKFRLTIQVKMHKMCLTLINCETPGHGWRQTTSKDINNPFCS